LWYIKTSPDLELNSTCWDFKHNAKGGNMTVKLKDLKVLSPDHKIYKEPFKTYSVNTSEQKSKNSNKVEFIRFSKHLNKQQRLEKLKKYLLALGLKYKKK